MRLGLIGLGRIGAFHAEGLIGLDAIDSLVVADARPGVADALAARLSGPACEVLAVDDPAALFVANVDGVVVAAATEAHPQLILAAVEAGLPVFCEKPVARQAVVAADVLARVRASGVEVQIGYNRRFDAGFVAARQAVADGHLGRVHTLRSTTMDAAPPPSGYLATSGGIFRDCSVHDFDIVRFVTGREVVEVYATGSAEGDPVFAASADVSTSAAILTMDDGAMVLISNSRYNPRGYDVRLELHGTKDSIAVGWDDRLPLRSVEPGVTFPAGEPHQFFQDRFEAAYRAELSAFTEVVAGRRTSPCTVADALEADWIAEACVLSLAEHRPVRVDEVRLAVGDDSKIGAG